MVEEKNDSNVNRITEVFEEACTLSARARFISKLIMADMPNLITEEEGLVQHEVDVCCGRVPRIAVSTVIEEALRIAGTKTSLPAMKRRRHEHLAFESSNIPVSGMAH